MSVMRKEADWWRGAVIYQIYPRSYQDSNGDGIGDLLGIVRRLPHIAGLGADAIWISPFFTSPMKDFGYDIADYRDIDPMFGSLADFDQVIETAHALGLKVMIDLVFSHTSDQHIWFQESRSSRDNPKSDWYVWAEPKPDGTVPNNWLGMFGGSAWHWDTRREQYYLHNFLTSQPDLNHHNPDVQQALLDTAHFWLDRGVDGFRLDVVNYYMHDEQLRDNPPLPPEQRNDSTAPKVNPYNHQLHLYDKNHPKNLEFIRKLRTLMNGFNAAALGEVGDSQRGLELLGEYTSGEDKVHMSYAFDFLSGHAPLSAQAFREVFDKVDEVAHDGWVCWAFSNHDVERHISRWKLTPATARLYTTLMVCMRGTLCVYQGEELGLPEAELEFDDLRDPYGIEFWPEFKGRDGARTPMVWEADAPYAGFSSAKPWLPISSTHQRLSADAANNDRASLIHHYRKAFAFRRQHKALRIGDIMEISAENGLLFFRRRHGSEDILCYFNLSDQPINATVPAGNWVTIAGEMGSIRPNPDHSLHLGPWQPSILILQRD